MSRKWIGGIVALAAVAGGAFAATSAFSTDAGIRPPTATVTVDLSRATAKAAAPGATKKPRLVYLSSSTPTTINPADPAAGGIGPYVDVALTGCSKVIDGGVVPSRFDVYQQGTYIKHPKNAPAEYHVLINLDNDSLANRTPFTIDTNLTCLKGVK
jgi:ABC-type transport system substrate-binding protein